MARKTSRSLSGSPLLPGERLKVARKALSKTQEKVATELGVTGAAISDWEGGNKPPSGGNPYLIEAWTRRAAEQLGRPDLIVRAVEWLNDEERARVAAMAPAMLGAA